MIDSNTLIIDEDTSIFGRFLDDGIEVESCPLITSASINRYLTGTNYKDVLALLRHLKLKIKIPENMIDGNILIRFLDDGIEVENCQSITSASIISYLNETEYKDALA